ncbi:MAG: biotin transporter BioY [Subdoligranulum sp.]|nr:biotin transporter BioY [Subdoligranulum sp.]
MKPKSAIKNYVLTALFAALTAVLAQIQLPIGPVPFNLAFFGMFLAGMLLTPAWAASAALLYLLLGLVGIPVFAGFQGGPAALLGNTGGYLVGYVFVALATSIAQHRSGRLPVVAAGMVLGVAICYTFGTAWFTTLSGASFSAALGWCVLPFIVPDLCKGAFAYAVGRMLSARLKAAGLTE